MNKILSIFLICILRGSAGSFITNIETGNSEIILCPGDRLAILCAHNNTGDGVTRWEVTGSQQCLVSHDPPPSSGSFPCGNFTINDISNATGSRLNSTAVAVASADIDGVTVECREGPTSTATLVGNVTIRILRVPAPAINIIEQLSRSTVRLTLSLADTRCLGGYTVRATAEGGPTTNYTSTFPVVDARGLDICRYNYTFVASVFTLEQVQGEENDPITLTPDLSVIEAPALSAPNFSLVNESIIFNVTIQNFNVPAGSYQYTIPSGGTSNTQSLSGDYFDIELPSTASEESVRVTVTFQEYQCTQSTTITYRVPSLVISNVEEGLPTPTTQTVKITLPLTSYQSNELLIVSTLSPPDIVPVTAAYVGPGEQYTVMFDNLEPSTFYNFTIRIVLNTDNAVIVVPSVTGNFTTAVTTPSTDSPTVPLPQGGCTGGCVAGVVIGVIIFLLLLGAGIIVVVIFLLRRRLFNDKPKTSVQMEEKKAVGPPDVDIEVS